MQLLLKLNGSNILLPINYRQLIHGMIYRLLSASEEYANSLHDRISTDCLNRPFKYFTFSPLKGIYHIADKNICFEGSVHLEIRSCDPQFINLLYKQLILHPNITLGHNDLYIEEVTVNNESVTDHSVIITMRSPVVAYHTDESRHTYFYSPDDDRFYRAIQKNAERKWRSINPEACFDFKISPCFIKYPAMQKSAFKSTYITGWFGRYQTEGNPLILSMLYDIGLGAKNSEGYGMFDIEKQK